MWRLALTRKFPWRGSARRKVLSRRRLISGLLSAGRFQLLGVAAQVLAALPISGLSIYLAHTVNLAAVADFAAVIGLSSVVYTGSLMGLRSRLILDRYATFEADDYIRLRVAAILMMAAAILSVGGIVEAPAPLILTVMLLRAGDGVLDLVLAIDQVRNDERTHLYGYLYGSIFKIIALALILGLREVLPLVSPLSACAIAAAIQCIFASHLLLARRDVSARVTLFATPRVKEAIALARCSIVFAVAQIICAVLVSYPRLSLFSESDRAAAGVMGAALSVATLVGMAHYAVWLRWAPKIGRGGLTPPVVLIFIVENAVVLLATIISLRAAGTGIVALMYGVTDLAHVDILQNTLILSAVFFCIMTIANLFKATQNPWGESGVYLSGLAIAGGATLYDGTTPAWLLLGYATAGMALFLLISLVVFFQRR